MASAVGMDCCLMVLGSYFFTLPCKVVTCTPISSAVLLIDCSDVTANLADERLNFSV